MTQTIKCMDRFIFMPYILANTEGIESEEKMVVANCNCAYCNCCDCSSVSLNTDR